MNPADVIVWMLIIACILSTLLCIGYVLYAIAVIRHHRKNNTRS